MNFIEHLELISNTSGSNKKIDLLVDFINDSPSIAFEIMSILKNPKISTYTTIKTFPDTLDVLGCDHTAESFFNYYLEFVISGSRFTADSLEIAVMQLNDIGTPLEIKWFKQIMCKQTDLKIGLSAWNKAVKKTEFKDLLIEDYKCLKVSNLDKAEINYEDCYTSLKHDGVNASFNPSRDEHLLSRLGNQIPLRHLEKELELFRTFGIVLFGELTVRGKNRQSASGLVNSAIQKGYESKPGVCDLVFNVFDAMYCDEYNSKKFTTPFSKRMLIAKDAVAAINSDFIRIVDHTHCTSLETVIKRNAEFVSNGGEGIIVNDANSIFDLKKIKSRGRIKDVFQGDLKIVGYTTHKRHPETMIGSLICETACGKLRINVGTGFSEQQRIDFFNNKESYLDDIAVINYNKVIKKATTEKGNHSHTLFLSVFSKISSDKLIADNLDDLEFGS